MTHETAGRGVSPPAKRPRIDGLQLEVFDASVLRDEKVNRALQPLTAGEGGRSDMGCLLLSYADKVDLLWLYEGWGKIVIARLPGGKIAGWADIHGSVGYPRERWLNVFVRPTLRGYGVGRELALLAFDLGLENASAVSTVDNRFYRSVFPTWHPDTSNPISPKERYIHVHTCEPPKV